MTDPEPSHRVGPQPIDALRVRNLTAEDIKSALRAGLSDYLARPLLSSSFGLVFAAGGFFVFASLFYFGQVWMVIPVALGFPLIAPFAAAGLYEMSRRLALDIPFNWRDIYLIVVRQSGKELGWMAFVVLFVFWLWIYQVRLLIALFLGLRPFSSLESFFQIVTSTSEGMLFLGIGTIVGTALACVLFCISVISMPLLLDRQIDFISAMLLSIRTVRDNPSVMLGWGAVIGVLIFMAMVPALLGLIVVLPVLGHTTWHIYRSAIEEISEQNSSEPETS
uniref:DUF2189 domain-containing protein n=1 Tax=Pararhizobium sp. IMCC3301 TaxID=3067904 RepID=UPI00274130D0|nr:DUF2189 domain-containing protein [Pararhizobium sp. IMCC3301]